MYSITLRDNDERARTMERLPRKIYTYEYKLEAVRLVGVGAECGAGGGVA